MLTSWTQRHASLARNVLLAAPATPADSERTDYAILTDGLQHLLEGCAEDVAERHFPAVLQAHRALRVQRRLLLAPSLPAQLLSDLCHEIAEVVEVPVRRAALRCLHHAAQRAAANAAA
jgi:hypothetical protein